MHYRKKITTCIDDCNLCADAPVCADCEEVPDTDDKRADEDDGWYSHAD